MSKGAKYDLYFLKFLFRLLGWPMVVFRRGRTNTGDKLGRYYDNQDKR